MAEGLEGRQFIRNRIRCCILNILHQVEARGGEVECQESALFRLEWLFGVVTRYYQCGFIDRHVIDLLAEALINLTSICSSEDLNVGPEVIFTGNRGRPKFNIPYEQLSFLVERRFTIKQIAAALGVSERTVERRLQHFGMSIRGTYTNLTLEELDSTVGEILRTQPYTGYKRMTGYLAARGHRVQQRRIRESMRRVDPEGTLIRALELNVIHRRSYSVPSPLALWHIDGNHKLIR